MRFAYTVWLRNESLPADDQDYEWPACFVIDASTADAARRWGDRLAERYAATSGERLIGSAVEAVDTSTLPGLDALPVIADGEEAPDEKIGW